MLSTRREPSHVSSPWRSTVRTHLLAVVLGVLPLYSSLILSGLRKGQPLTTHEYIFYLAVISPVAIVIALVLLRFLCREDLRELNLRPGTLSSDLLAALILCPVIIVANVISTQLLANLLPESASNPSVRNLFAGLARDPAMFVLFLALLIPLGAASEELVRVFLLSRLWKVWASTTGRLAGVAISACLFGLIHVYRGPVAVGWTAIYGLVVALYYFRYGRVVPLILAHYLTNALQVIVFAART